jgi:hypothetical protein
MSEHEALSPVGQAYTDLRVARSLLECRVRLGAPGEWPDDLPRPEGVQVEVSEADCQLLEARLRDLLNPFAPRDEGEWVRVFEDANADQLIESIDRLAREHAAELAEGIVRKFQLGRTT